MLAAAGVEAYLVYQTYVVDNIFYRIIVLSAVLAVGCLLCAHELLRGPARTLRTPAVLAAVLFALVAATLAFRAVWIVVSPPEPDLFAPSAAQSIYFLVSLIGKILFVVSLLMMAAQRLQWQLEVRNGDLETAKGRAEDASRAGIRIPGDDEP